MPCHTRDKDGKAIGIQDKCDMCYNYVEKTDHSYAAMAKQVQRKKWFKTDKPVEMKKFDRSADTTFMTNLLTDEFPLLDGRFRRLAAVKLS